MQIIFFKKLIIILKIRQTYAKDRYKSEKLDDFSFSQKRGFIYR